MRRRFLLHEEYVVLMRAEHPLARRRPTRAGLARLDYVLVRSHPATGRALTGLGLDDRVRLTIPHFMVLPRILADSDLAVVMPSRLALAFRRLGRYATWKLRVGPAEVRRQRALVVVASRPSPATAGCARRSSSCSPKD